MDLTEPPTEIEVAELLEFLHGITAFPPMIDIVRRLAFERDRLRSGLREISTHSVCCDARHHAEALLDNNPTLKSSHELY